MYNNIIYATEQEARSYLLPTATQALFMDPTSPTFYVKATDAFGSPSFEIYDFVARKSTPNETPLTRADLDAFKQEILSIIHQTPAPQNTQPQEVTNNG